MVKKNKFGKNDLPEESPALSMMLKVMDSIEGRKIAILIADGANGVQVKAAKESMIKKGAAVEIVGTRMGVISGIKTDKSLDITTAFHYDALLIPGGKHIEILKGTGTALRFVAQTYKQCKAICAIDNGKELFKESVKGKLGDTDNYPGVVFDDNVTVAVSKFMEGIKHHRDWSREATVLNMPV